MQYGRAWLSKRAWAKTSAYHGMQASGPWRIQMSACGAVWCYADAQPVSSASDERAAS